MTFDPGDEANWSLYLCEPAGGSACERVVLELRAAMLWSGSAPKRIAAREKEAYKSQLQLVEAREHRVFDQQVLLLRCTHPRFPSDARRWQAWNETLLRLIK